MKRNVAVTGSLAMGMALLLGCRAETAKTSTGDHVKIESPLGGLQLRVKTNDDAAGSGTGVPVYPGATLVKEGDSKKNNGTADINLSFGSMHLRVEVLSYRTPDGPEEVRGFYAKELGRFGTVIACVDDQPSGEPTRTPEGLTCDKDERKSRGILVGASNGSSVELKAGSPQHQHAVGIEKDGSGTKFALIRIDLPGEFTLGGGDDKGERPKQ